MHESGMIKGLLRKVDSILVSEPASRVSALRVWIGPLAGISADHFREHFVHDAQGSSVQDATLLIEMGEDPTDPNAQSILLKGIDVED